MDEHYNFKEASELWITEIALVTIAHGIETVEDSLRSFVAERHDYDTNQLTNFKHVRDCVGAIQEDIDDWQVDKLEPVLNDQPKYWRLTVPTSEVTQSEELVLSMQGVIVSKDLPPMLKK